MATKQVEFKAEIQQVLDILIHSLYTEKEIFLRELVSNASDALNRFKLESLKSQEVVDAGTELGIWLEADEETSTLTLRDSGVGMTQDDMVSYLGTIAQSGAKNFIEAMKEINKGETKSTVDVIGQFGVGFYSVFMVADEVTVTSRSLEPEAEAAYWKSAGKGSYEVGKADKDTRGTTIEIKLKEDAKEFAQAYRLRQIVKQHSDFVAFPIYLKEKTDDGETFNQINAQTALWRERSADVEDEQYKTFYQQLTFDFSEPLKTIHFSADMPIQFYALLYIPSRQDYKVFGSADDYGLNLYARKVLIQEDFKELLPPWLRFFEGVVDSEDLQLNVSREAVQATPLIARIRKVLVGRITSELGKLADNDPESYAKFYKEFGQFIKEGVASDPSSHEKLLDLLRFASTKSDGDLVSLKTYLERMNEDQKDIYYVLGDDVDVVAKNAGLEYFRKNDLEVLYFTDPLDTFVSMNLSEYEGKALKNISDSELELPQDEDKLETPADEGFISLTAFIKQTLGERVEDVRESKVLTDSPARLVDPVGGSSSAYRAQKLMGRETQIPKKILELNPKSDLLQDLASRLKADDKDPMLTPLVEQMFENELLMEGIHPNPAEMIPRIQKLMAQAARSSADAT